LPYSWVMEFFAGETRARRKVRLGKTLAGWLGGPVGGNGHFGPVGASFP